MNEDGGAMKIVLVGKEEGCEDGPRGNFRFLPLMRQVCRNERLVQFVKFCVVGGSGLFVDMGILFLLADTKCLGLNITLSKICAAETAMINNFIWNELCTFRQRGASLAPIGGESQGEGDKTDEITSQRFNVLSRLRAGVVRRFLLFNAICGIGIGLAVLLLHLFHTWLGWDLYVSNLLAIILVTWWNFGMNARYNWGITKQRATNAIPHTFHRDSIV